MAKTKRSLVPLLMNWMQTSRNTSADPAMVRVKALKLLAQREHSRLELRQKLIQRGFAPDHIEQTLNQLTKECLLDEDRYAELYACSRADRGYGPLRIARELRERGISEERVAVALLALEELWQPKLRALHRKRFNALIPADATERMQQTRMLRQRGFTADQIKHLFEPV